MKSRGTRIGAILILLLLTATTAVVILGTDIFNIKKISIMGSQHIERNVIISISGISYGDSIFKVNRRQVRENIESRAPYPIVKDVVLRLPDEVEIYIEERAPVAYIPFLSSYLLIDENAFIMDLIKQDESSDQYFKIEGLREFNFKKGTQFEFIESEKIKQVVLNELLDSIYKRGVQHMISEISLENVDNIKLLTRQGVLLELGQAVQLEKKLAWLLSDAYTEIVNSDMKGTLDVSVAEKAVFRPDQDLNEVSD